VLNLKTAEPIGIAFTEALLAIDEASRRPQSEANDEQFRHWSGRALNSHKPLEDEMTETKQSILVNRSGRSNPRRLVDDVIPAIDIKRLTGDEAGRVVREKGRGEADVVDAYQTAGRRLGPCLFE
jgi:hypothetical protein